jgi:hypothetical protein
METIDDLIETLDCDPLKNPLVAIIQQDSTLIIPLQIKKIAECIVQPEMPDEEKYMKLCNWIVENIEYDEELRRKIRRGADSDDWPSIINILKKQAGICQDMAHLYVVLAKSVGLKAQYARIVIDCEGERVKHACAYIGDNSEGKPHYVDPAYRGDIDSFNVKHQHAKIKNNFSTDQHVMEFMLMNHRNSFYDACKSEEWGKVITEGYLLLKFEPSDSVLIKENMSTAFNNIGAQLSNAGKTDYATKAWELSLEHDPNNEPAARNLEKFSRQGE